MVHRKFPLGKNPAEDCPCPNPGGNLLGGNPPGKQFYVGQFSGHVFYCAMTIYNDLKSINQELLLFLKGMGNFYFCVPLKNQALHKSALFFVK